MPGTPQRPRIAALTVFLLRKEIDDPTTVLSGTTADEMTEVALGSHLPFTARLFVRRPAGRHPWWESFLSEGTAAPLVVQTRTGGALLFVRTHKHWFAFTFGTGRFALDPSSYERDFGLRVTLNAVDPRALRSIDMQTVEDLTVQTRRQVSRRSGLEVFELDQVRDILRGVVGEPADPAVAQLLAGSDRLAFRGRVRFSDLANKCGELLTLHDKQNYRQHFGFIDHMRRVGEPDLIDQLNELLVDRINRGTLATAHLAPPEPIEWDDFGGFRYLPLDRGTRPRSDLDLAEFLQAFADGYGREVSLADLKKGQRVAVVSAATGDPLKRWTLLDTIVAELEWSGARYVLSGGDWFEVDKTFVAATARTIAALRVSTLRFPDAQKDEWEPAYLERVTPLLAEAESVEFAVLDRKLVACAGAPSQMEVCDIFSQTGQFIHVKRRTASATLSHLFTQGTSSATAFIRDATFRRGARAKIPVVWDGAGLFPDDAPDVRNYSLIFAVIAPGAAPLAEILPFLSQVSLMHAAQILLTMGFPLEVAHITEART
jgi:uncharacterized protein (TIGR04141 family)